MSGNILEPLLLYFHAVVEVQLTIDNLPGIRINGSQIAFTQSLGTVATILRRVSFRIADKKSLVFSARKSPSRPIPLIGKLAAALNWLTLLEISNRISTPNC